MRVVMPPKRWIRLQLSIHFHKENAFSQRTHCHILPTHGGLDFCDTFSFTSIFKIYTICAILNCLKMKKEQTFRLETSSLVNFLKMQTFVKYWLKTVEKEMVFVNFKNAAKVKCIFTCKKRCRYSWNVDILNLIILWSDPDCSRLTHKTKVDT